MLPTISISIVLYEMAAFLLWDFGVMLRGEASALVVFVGTLRRLVLDVLALLTICFRADFLVVDITVTS